MCKSYICIHHLRTVRLRIYRLTFSLTNLRLDGHSGPQKQLPFCTFARLLLSMEIRPLQGWSTVFFLIFHVFIIFKAAINVSSMQMQILHNEYSRTNIPNLQFPRLQNFNFFTEKPNSSKNSMGKSVGNLSIDSLIFAALACQHSSPGRILPPFYKSSECPLH